jgi:hypothetical protein
MARVEIPAPGDLIMDSAGNVRAGVDGLAQARRDGHGRHALQRPDRGHVHHGRSGLRV